MKTRFSLVVLALSFMIVQPGCAHSERPVLYPNDHLKQVGSDQAQADVDDCMQLATEYGADSTSGGKVAEDTAGGAVIGRSVDRPRTSEPCGVLTSTPQVRAPAVAQWHGHLHDLATVFRA
jgi:hypothetical protein